MNIKTIAQELATKYNLDVLYLWDNQDVVSWAGTDHPQLNILTKQPFFAIPNAETTIIKIDLNTKPSDTGAPAGVSYLNILCHELGHLIAYRQGVIDPYDISGLELEHVVAYERAANTVGIELYSEYEDPSTYWNNHEDIDRMRNHYQLYMRV